MIKYFKYIMLNYKKKITTLVVKVIKFYHAKQGHIFKQR